MRVRVNGTYDELGAQIGRAIAELPPELEDVRAVLQRLSHELFVAQAELGTATGKIPHHQITSSQVERLERDIDRFQPLHPPVHSFVLPGGSRPAAQLHICRAVARRAETELLCLHRTEPARPELLAWANRLSDLLFTLALVVNRQLGVREVPPDYSV